MKRLFLIGAVLGLMVTALSAAGCGSLRNWAEANPEAAGNTADSLRGAGATVGGLAAGVVGNVVGGPVGGQLGGAVGSAVGEWAGGALAAALGLGAVGTLGIAGRKYVQRATQAAESEGRHAGWDEREEAARSGVPIVILNTNGGPNGGPSPSGGDVAGRIGGA